MRKSVIDAPPIPPASREGQWLDLPTIASVQVTSEDPAFPIESAFSQDRNEGWRAAKPGEQIIRILFDHPVSLRRIQLRFLETEQARTQEFALLYLTLNGGPREIVRQQWNFSPDGSTSEAESYRVELADVSTLELTIKPDIGGHTAIASLASLLLA